MGASLSKKDSGERPTLANRSKRKKGKWTTKDRNLFSSLHFQFHQFPQLSNDIAMEIISYVAEGPFEREEIIKSPLTHILPLVNKQFRQICNSDILWIEALCRLANKYPSRCKEVLVSLLTEGDKKPTWSVFYEASIDKDHFMLASRVKDMNMLNSSQINALILSVFKSLSTEESEKDEFTKKSKHSTRNRKQTRIGSAKSLHLHIVREFSFVTLPVFHMRSNSVSAGVYMTLTFFEPRYCMLINEAMEGRPASELSGSVLQEPRPKFIFANKSGHGSLSNGAMAYLVEISRCRMLEGGRAHIMIKPLKKVKMVRVSERPGVRNGLRDARIKRFEKIPLHFFT